MCASLSPDIWNQLICGRVSFINMSSDKQPRGSSRYDSLFKKSMQMLVRLAGLSTSSSARMSLGSSPSAPPPAIAKVSVVREPVVFPGSGISRRSQVPDASRITYLVEPEGSENNQMLGKGKCVDGMATEYIRRVRERNRLDSHEEAKLFQDILPPPPAPYVRK